MRLAKASVIESSYTFCWLGCSDGHYLQIVARDTSRKSSAVEVDLLKNEHEALISFCIIYCHVNQYPIDVNLK